MNRKIKFYLLIALQVALLLAMIGRSQFTLLTGRKVVLEVVPVDPRDLFAGEYVRLNYKISSIALPPYEKSRKVYVKLKKDGDYWQGAGVSETKPVVEDDEVFVLGKTRKWGGIEFGVERYYVPEGRAVEIERMIRTTKIAAEVSVDRFGNAVITRLLADGKGL